MSDADDDGVGQREVAYRLFATEFDDADLSHSAGDDDRSPNYVVTPSGARVNRLFAVGVLTEIEQVSEDVLRGRVVDPTGAFVTYAGQYQPDVQAFLERASPPMFVAITGKARTFQPEDSERVFSSVRPESINEVDAETRDRWTVQTAEQTLDRIAHIGEAIELGQTGETLEETLQDRDVSEGLSAGIPLALQHYGTTPTYLDDLRDVALDATRVVAGETDEVSEMSAAPDDRGSATVSDITDRARPTLDSTDPSADTPDGLSTAETAKTESPAGTAGDTKDAAGESPLTEATSDDSETAVVDETETSPTGESEATSDASETTVTDETARTGESEATETDERERIDGERGGDTTESVGTGALDGPGEFDPEEFELEAETREQLEAEYGTEFQTGTEVDEPGAAGIETPAVDEATADSDTKAQTASESSEATGDTQSPPAGGEESDTESPDDIQSAVVALMSELDEGSGVASETLTDEMAARHGVAVEETENAIQDALMDGECYEPDEGTFKPI